MFELLHLSSKPFICFVTIPTSYFCSLLIFLILHLPGHWLGSNQWSKCPSIYLLKLFFLTPVTKRQASDFSRVSWVVVRSLPIVPGAPGASIQFRETGRQSGGDNAMLPEPPAHHLTWEVTSHLSRTLKVYALELRSKDEVATTRAEAKATCFRLCEGRCISDSTKDDLFWTSVSYYFVSHKFCNKVPQRNSFSVPTAVTCQGPLEQNNEKRRDAWSHLLGHGLNTLIEGPQCQGETGRGSRNNH